LNHPPINGGRIIIPEDAKTYLFGGLKVVTTATVDELVASGKVVEALVVACVQEQEKRDAEAQSLTQLCEALSDEIVLLRETIASSGSEK
jgi:hypothetical protein